MSPRSIEADPAADPVGLQALLGHTFSNPELLLCALTHRSLANELSAEAGGVKPSQPSNNERLEFLGDAVIGLIVAEALFQAHPDWNEGNLTIVRAQLVSREHMAQVAAAVNLGSYLRLSRGEERGGLRRTGTVLSNTMEAVLGALFLDGGLEPVRAFVRRYILGETAEKLARELRSGAALGNYKSALQEHLQGTRAGTPVYRVKGESGAEHRKRFLIEVRLKSADGELSKPLASGVGSTKKHAEQDAARRAVNRLMAQAAKSAAPQAREVNEEELSEE